MHDVLSSLQSGPSSDEEKVLRIGENIETLISSQEADIIDFESEPLLVIKDVSTYREEPNNQPCQRTPTQEMRPARRISLESSRKKVAKLKTNSQKFEDKQPTKRKLQMQSSKYRIYPDGGNNCNLHLDTSNFKEKVCPANGPHDIKACGTREFSNQVAAAEEHDPRVEIKFSKDKDKLEVRKTKQRKRATKDNHDNDPDYAPGQSPKLKKALKWLKCHLCGQEAASRSNLYGHYSSCHFKTQLLEHIGADKRYCEQHWLTFSGEAHVAAHYGRVHNMVEEFLPPQFRIPQMSSCVLSEGQKEPSLEQKDNNQVTINQLNTVNKETGLEKGKWRSIELGRQKRERREDQKSKSEEEFRPSSEDLLPGE